MSFDKWQASISLLFKVNTDGKTIMYRNLHQGPLMVQKPFYPEKACHIYLLHPPGGIAGCDSLQVSAVAQEDSKVLITTPGATKFYKTDGSKSSFTQIFEVEDNASLEFLPAQNIYFKGTHTTVKTIFKLKGNAKFAFRDVSKCGMEDSINPFEDSSFFNTICIEHDGVEKFIEVSSIEGDEDIKAISSNHGHVYIGTYLSNKVSQSTLEKIRELLTEDTTFKASAGIIDDYLCVRFLSHNNESIEKAIVSIWILTRHEVIGLLPCVPRIWST